MAVVECDFETDNESHVPWYGCTTEQNAGALLVTQTDDFAGVQLGNYPYFSGISVGATYVATVEYIEDTSTNPEWELTVIIYDESVESIWESDPVPMPRSVAGATVVSDPFVVPSGAVTIGWNFAAAESGTGSALRILNFTIDPPSEPDPEPSGGLGSFLTFFIP